jgi:APA family basic amino acid/polyamine antiporter
MFKAIDPHTNIPNNSSLVGLIAVAFWLFFFYGANLTSGWFGVFNFDSSELPIITLYAMYIPIFINFMRKEKDMGVFRRFVLPSLATVGAFFMICATIYAHGIQPYLKAKAEGNFAFPVLFYLIVLAVIVGAGILLRYLGRRMKNDAPVTEESAE